ncbi:MAG: rRNA maturation RNase YbeY [Simkania sp.]|nr:rRNA maturation RNase YbeY [Simkania sp.]
MKITFHHRQKDLKIASVRLRRYLLAFLLQKQVCCNEVIVHFVSKKKIGQLHKELFNDPTPTDCISIPLDSPQDTSPFSVLGEIFVCPKVACEYAAAHDGDPHRETLLYVIHGLLHLLGFDDIAAKDRKRMRSEEKKALALISHLQSDSS